MNMTNYPKIRNSSSHLHPRRRLREATFNAEEEATLVWRWYVNLGCMPSDEILIILTELDEA